VTNILHPELINLVPFANHAITERLEAQAAATLQDSLAADPPMSIVIRARNEALQLGRLFEDIAAQRLRKDPQIVVVDNASSDATRDVARAFGATVVKLPENDFTYPHSMNLGMEAARHDAVLMTVAHARLATRLTLHAMVRHMNGPGRIAGVFGSKVQLPTEQASRGERLLSGLEVHRSLLAGPRRIRRAGLGVMGAVGAMFSKSVWEELGHFDERYETGGEDTVLAKAMLKVGYGIIKDPAAVVHHAHGLNPYRMAEEALHCQLTLLAPRKLEGDVKTRRQGRFKD